MPPLGPWPIYGIISGAGAGVTVTATNNTTDETQTALTESDSAFLIDAANFTSGYTDGDIITISAPSYPDMDVTIDVTTYPDGIGVFLSQPSAFDIFDHPYIILKSIVIPGYTSQADGSWAPESSSDMIIKGHVTDITIKDLQRVEPGIFTLGDRRLALDKNIGLVVGDNIKIWEDSTGTEVSEWFVKVKQSTSYLLDSPRDTFLLSRKT